MATDSLKKRGKVDVNQGQVWGHVEKVLGESDAASPSRSYHAALKSSSLKLDDYEERLECPDGTSGAAILIDGRVEAIDLFDKPQTFKKLWPEIARGYAMHAIYRLDGPARHERVGEFLDEIRGAEKVPFDTVGIGTSLRLTGKTAVGAALTYGEIPIHTTLFATPCGRQNTGDDV